MHNHDHDLIAALAGGVLADAQAASATADIAGCLECQSELDAQRLALSALSQAPTPGLSMQESAQMRRGVADALGLEEAPTARRERRLPWAGLVTASVVLVAVVAAAPLLNLLSTSEDDSTDFSQTEARSEVGTQESGVDDLASAPEAAADAVPPASEAPAATALSATGADGALNRSKVLAFGEISQEDIESIRDGYAAYRSSGFSTAHEELQLSDEQLDVLNSQLGALELQDALIPFCDITATESWVYQQIGLGTLDGRQVLVFVGPFDDADPEVILLDAETCEVVTPSGDQ